MIIGPHVSQRTGGGERKEKEDASGGVECDERGGKE